MSSPVKLYVYDLSNGLARQLSLQFTGKQIDGIWHTSIVVFNKEIFYGRGISAVTPGHSHHGRPIQILDMGETALDEDTFQEYLHEMRNVYTADKYHLLDFNCNSFTNDCTGFLTGGSIPSWIKDLPSDFLSTPLGQAIRPTIDNMFGTPDTSRTPSPAASSPVATLESPIHIVTNPSSFHSLLAQHRAVVAFFTSQTCAPCRMVEPAFEEAAKTHSKAAFAKIDFSVGMAALVAQEYNVTATPTFLYFLDGNKTAEVKGADAGEMKTQVDLLLYETNPPHPHYKLDLPAISALSLNPILLSQVPALDVVVSKLESFIDSTPESTKLDKAFAKNALRTQILPYLKDRFVSNAPRHLSEHALTSWKTITLDLCATLPSSDLFPAVDIWRLGLLDDRVAQDSTVEVTQALIARAAAAPESRTLVLTTLRMTANALAYPALLDPRGKATDLLVSALLHPDSQIRLAGASVAFNMGARAQKRRRDRLEDDAEWEVEVTSALVEALKQDELQIEAAHRLLAALSLILYCSQHLESELGPLLEVLQVQDMLHQVSQKNVDRADVQGITRDLQRICESFATPQLR